jgi:hypothetical protein
VPSFTARFGFRRMPVSAKAGSPCRSTPGKAWPLGRARLRFRFLMRTIDFDEEFGPEQFHVEPTPGMVVWDTTTDKRYIQGEPGQPDVEIGRATAEEQLAGGGGRSCVGVVLAGTSLVIVVVVGAAVWLRRR